MFEVPNRNGRKKPTSSGGDRLGHDADDHSNDDNYWHSVTALHALPYPNQPLYYQPQSHLI